MMHRHNKYHTRITSQQIRRVWKSAESATLWRTLLFAVGPVHVRVNVFIGRDYQMG